MSGSVIVRRLAGLSGASAVAAGAYGAHGRQLLNSSLASMLERTSVSKMFNKNS